MAVERGLRKASVLTPRYPSFLLGQGLAAGRQAQLIQAIPRLALNRTIEGERVRGLAVRGEQLRVSQPAQVGAALARLRRSELVAGLTHRMSRATTYLGRREKALILGALS